MTVALVIIIITAFSAAFLCVLALTRGVVWLEKRGAPLWAIASYIIIVSAAPVMVCGMVALGLTADQIDDLFRTAKEI